MSAAGSWSNGPPHVGPVRLDRIKLDEHAASDPAGNDGWDPATLEMSIRQHGILVPLRVGTFGGSTYYVLDGNHRAAIAKQLGIAVVVAEHVEWDEYGIVGRTDPFPPHLRPEPFS